MHSDLVAELPFILMHPKPEDFDENNIIIDGTTSNNNNINNNKSKTSLDNKQNQVNTNDDTPNLIQLDG